MINYDSTSIGRAYTQYRVPYLSALAQNRFELVELNEGAMFGVMRNTGIVPKSNVPYYFDREDDLNTTGKSLVLTDCTGIRDLEADMRYVHSILMLMWEDPTISERFSVLRKFATRAYVNWVSRALVQRFNIEYQDKLTMDILLGTFFYSAGGTPQEFFNKQEFNNLRQLQEAIEVPATRIADTHKQYGFDSLEETYRLDDLVVNLKEISPDMKSKISVSGLTSVVSRSWYGEGGAFYCNLAVEYPPMFMTLLYFALVAQDYKRTPLANTVREFVVGRNVSMGDMYTKQFAAYVKGINPTPIQH